MKRLLDRWYVRHFHLFQRWYWLGKIDAVPLAEYRKLQDSYMRLCSDLHNCAIAPTLKASRPHPVVTTDYERRTLCS